MLINAGYFEIADEGMEECLEALRTARPKVLQEAGCHLYEFGVDIVRPNRVNLFEIYDDMDALVAHRAEAHTAELFAVLGPHVTARDITAYDAQVAPRPGG